MIIKIFNTNERTGRGCINYLLGRQFEREGASVISGLPLLTNLIIDSSKLKKSYVSGVISLKGKNVDDRLINKITHSFQLLSCAGLSENQVNFLWVKHTDKNHAELNFVVPCIDLKSGKNINFLDKKYDYYFLTRFCCFFDALYGYASPLDPINKRSLIINEKLSAAKKLEIVRLHDLAMRDIGSRLITSREKLYEFYVFHGYEVTHVNSKSVTISNAQSKKKYKLAGFLYDEGFDFSPDFYEKLKLESRTFHLYRLNRLAEARQALVFSIQCRVNKQARYVNSYLDEVLYDRAIQFIDDLLVAVPDLIITSDDEARSDCSVDSLASDSLSMDEFDGIDDEGLESEESYDYGP